MRDLLKYGLIASAGQPRSLTGEALIGLGALLSQMDFNLGEGEEKSDDIEITDEPTEEYLKYKMLGDVDQKAEDEKIQKKYDDAMAFDPNSVQVEDLFQYNESDFGIIPPSKKIVQSKNTTIQGAENSPHSFLFTNTPGFGPEGREYKKLISEVKAGKKSAIFARDYIEKRGGVWTGVDTDYSSVLNRLKPEVLKILNNARYKNKGKDDTPLHRIAHVTNSPYLRTDNVDYRQMRQATAPSYTGEIGKAAVEGYNLVIDKYNYDQAVKADYEEELEDQMGSLNVEADFLTDQARQDYLELSMSKKKRLNEAFNSYANGDISKLDYENVKANLVSELQAAAATRTNITNSIKDFIENKGTIDVGASDREMLDFLMTGEKSPERISIKNIDGVDYVTGTTRGGRDFKVPTSKIANGTAGFRVVKRASLAPVISGALKNINAYTSSVKTDLGFGVSTPSPEKARQIGIASIRNTLGSNEADLRSIMSQIYGVDHTAYQNFLGSDPAANKSAMLDDAAEHLYDTQVAEKYFPMTKTTKFRTEKTGSTTAGEREKAQFVKDWNSAALPTTENIISEYTGLLSEKYRIQELKDGNFGIVKTDDPKAGIKKIDMSKSPSDIKQQLLDFAQFRVKTGGTQQDLSLYNFEL